VDIVAESKYLLAHVKQTSTGEVSFYFLTSPLKEQDPDKARQVLARLLKTVEVALIVEGLL
jgi:hypothetical protein